jgi:hypothetical protein
MGDIIKSKIMDYEQIESSQRQHHEVCQHNEKMTILSTELDFKLFQMLNPKIYQDGDEWCCLYGENIAVGIVGFGKTPQKAIIDWNGAWYREERYCMPDNVTTKEEHEQYLKDIQK